MICYCGNCGHTAPYGTLSCGYWPICSHCSGHNWQVGQGLSGLQVWTSGLPWSGIYAHHVYSTLPSGFVPGYGIHVPPSHPGYGSPSGYIVTQSGYTSQNGPPSGAVLHGMGWSGQGSPYIFTSASICCGAISLGTLDLTARMNQPQKSVKNPFYKEEWYG